MSLIDLSSRICNQWLVEEAIQAQNSSLLRCFPALRGRIGDFNTHALSHEAAIHSAQPWDGAGRVCKWMCSSNRLPRRGICLKAFVDAVVSQDGLSRSLQMLRPVRIVRAFCCCCCCCCQQHRRCEQGSSNSMRCLRLECCCSSQHSNSAPPRALRKPSAQAPLIFWLFASHRHWLFALCERSARTPVVLRLLASLTFWSLPFEICKLQKRNAAAQQQPQQHKAKDSGQIRSAFAAVAPSSWTTNQSSRRPQPRAVPSQKSKRERQWTGPLRGLSKTFSTVATSFKKP